MTSRSEDFEQGYAEGFQAGTISGKRRERAAAEAAPLTEWAEGKPETPAQWAYELALIISKARFGPGVDMGGKHNPRPSEQREARWFVDSILAAAAEAAPHAEVDAAAWHAAVCESPTGKAEAAPLDVERLADAMHAAGVNCTFSWPGSGCLTNHAPDAERTLAALAATSREGEG